MKNRTLSLHQLNHQQVLLLMPTIVLLVLLMLVGVVGNASVLYVYPRFFRKSSSYFIILTLGVVDLFSNAVVLPLQIYKACHPLEGMGRVVCVLTKVLEDTVLLSHSLLLVCLTVDRYLKICRPHYFVSVHKVKVLCGLSLLFPLLYTLPNTKHYGISRPPTPVPGVRAVRCGLSSCEGWTMMEMASVHHGLLAVLFLAVFLVLLFLHVLIVSTVRRQHRRRVGERLPAAQEERFRIMARQWMTRRMEMEMEKREGMTTFSISPRSLSSSVFKMKNLSSDISQNTHSHSCHVVSAFVEIPLPDNPGRRLKSVHGETFPQRGPSPLLKSASDDCTFYRKRVATFHRRAYSLHSYFRPSEKAKGSQSLTVTPSFSLWQLPFHTLSPVLSTNSALTDVANTNAANLSSVQIPQRFFATNLSPDSLNSCSRHTCGSQACMESPKPVKSGADVTPCVKKSVVGGGADRSRPEWPDHKNLRVPPFSLHLTIPGHTDGKPSAADHRLNAPRDDVSRLSHSSSDCPSTHADPYNRINKRQASTSSPSTNQFALSDTTGHLKVKPDPHSASPDHMRSETQDSAQHSRRRSQPMTTISAMASPFYRSVQRTTLSVIAVSFIYLLCLLCWLLGLAVLGTFTHPQPHSRVHEGVGNFFVKMIFLQVSICPVIYFVYNIHFRGFVLQTVEGAWCKQRRFSVNRSQSMYWTTDLHV